MITEERRDKALDYLARTDEPCAKARALMKGLEKQEKTILAKVFLEVEGTDGVRKEKAKASKEYIDWQEKYKAAVLDYETMYNYRNTAEMIIELWRSENSNRRAGMV